MYMTYMLCKYYLDYNIHLILQVYFQPIMTFFIQCFFDIFIVIL